MHTYIYTHAICGYRTRDDLQESQRAQAAKRHAGDTPQRVVAQDPAEEKKKRRGEKKSE